MEIDHDKIDQKSSCETLQSVSQALTAEVVPSAGEARGGPPCAEWVRVEIAELKKAPIAVEAVRRIDAQFAIEREINGVTAEGRRAGRTEHSRPLVTELEAWLREHRARLSAKSEVAKATDYLLKRCPAFTRFVDDSRVCLEGRTDSAGHGVI
jgi:Transposase IS66 family